jgi:hypothetical protein
LTGEGWGEGEKEVFSIDYIPLPYEIELATKFLGLIMQWNQNRRLGRAKESIDGYTFGFAPGRMRNMQGRGPEKHR